MLERTGTTIIHVVGAPLPQPTRLTSQYLAKNHLTPQARAKLALRLIHGEPIEGGWTVAQAARLARVSPARIRQQLDPADVQRMAKTFQRASTNDRIAFVNAVGSEEIWSALQAAI